MFKKPVHHLWLFSVAILMSLGLALTSAQGTDTSGQVMATWTAHSGFSDTSLQVWYSVFFAEEGNVQDGGVYKNTQALSTTFTGLTVGTSYVYSITVLGCSSSEAANIEEDTRNPSCSESAQNYASTRVTATSAGVSDSPDTEICAKAYSGPGFTGEISFSWDAHAGDAQNPGSVIWYCVAGDYESIATTDTSATLGGLQPDSQYSWIVDAFSCVGDETMAAGTCRRMTDDAHASGTAVATALVNGEATYSWDAHSFTDTSLQVWYWVGIQHPDTTVDWMKTQATSNSWTGLAAGFEYSILLDANGCTATEVAGFTDGNSPLCSDFMQLDDGTWKVTATLIGGTSSGGTSDVGTSDGGETVGELRLSWDAHSFTDSSLQVWYWVTLSLPDSTEEYMKTQATSVTFTGLTIGQEYSYLLDAYGCTANEVSGFTEGNPPYCNEFMQLDDGTWTGTAVKSGSGGGGSKSSGGSAKAASAPPSESFIDHSVTVSGSAISQAVTNSGIGNPMVIAQGVISASDIWGYVPAGTGVCFNGRSGGGVMFLDASTSPRALSWLPHSMVGSDTCVQLPGPGTVVLVAGVGPHSPAAAQQPVAAAQPAPAAQAALCQIKLEATLYLRDMPDGQIIAIVWLNTEVPVFEIHGDWYRVEFEGQFGYISRNYRQVLSGSC